MDSSTVGVVVGRFQIDRLHEGHTALLSYVTKHHDRVIVFIGGRNINPDNFNPLSYDIRAGMITHEYPHIETIPILDHKLNEEWSKNLDKLIGSVVGKRKVQLYTGRDGFNTAYSGRHSVQVLNLGVDNITATHRRELLRTTRNQNTAFFRAGIIQGVADRYPTVEATADCAILRTGQHGVIEILLGKRKNDGDGPNVWRLPGGFANGPEELEVTATREAAEETGLALDPTAWKYICNMNVDDWRVRGSDDHFIRTTFFMAKDAHFGAERAGDDLEVVKWFPLHHLGIVIVAGHQPLMDKLLTYIRREEAQDEA